MSNRRGLRGGYVSGRGRGAGKRPGSGFGEHGAGFAGARADLIAELVAAILNEDVDCQERLIAGLDREVAGDRSPVGGQSLRKRLVACLGSYEAITQPSAARAVGRGCVGDVHVRVGKTLHRIEIKAQLEKAHFAHLTQADWVRNETDALRWLLENDKEKFRLSEDNTNLLGSCSALPKGWAFADLWLADVAGMTSAQARKDCGVRRTDELGEFLKTKHLLHMCKEGDRITALADIEPVRLALEDRGLVSYTCGKNRQSEATVKVAVQGGRTAFTYHVYPPGYKSQPGLVGRHKLHGTILPY